MTEAVYIDNCVGWDLDCYMIYIADQQPVGLRNLQVRFKQSKNSAFNY